MIWLHGLGDTSAGFLDYFMLPDSPLHKGGRIKLLQAPIRAVTVDAGNKYPSWYDIKMWDFEDKIDEDKRCSLAEVKESLEIVGRKVEEEA